MIDKKIRGAQLSSVRLSKIIDEVNFIYYVNNISINVLYPFAISALLKSQWCCTEVYKNFL